MKLKAYQEYVIVALVILLFFGVWFEAIRAVPSPASTSTSSAGIRVATYDTNVPPDYVSSYATLRQLLVGFNQTLSSAAPVQKHQVTFGAELLAANANRGQTLLSPEAMQGVIANLNALQTIGLSGVTVAVSYPVYTPSFPNYTSYVNFYKRVAEQVHLKGMKLDVEAGVVFANTPFSAVQVNYTGLTYDSYVSAKKQMVQAIINDLHPDYLNLGTEPDTEYMLLHFSQFLTPDGYYGYVSTVLQGLNKSNTKVGAGIGTWDSISYVQKYVTDPRIDVITMHVYPVYGSNFKTMTQVGDLAKQYGKRIVIDEAWMTKSVTPESSSVAADANIFKRDVFGFWAPLDQMFLRVLVRFAQTYVVDYISPFWSQYFFAYLNYSPSNANLSFSQLATMVNQQAAQNIVGNVVTPTGFNYGKLIKQSG